MVVRNHIFTDPESTPPRGGAAAASFRQMSPANRTSAPSAFSDDAWYEGSGESSPAGHDKPLSGFGNPAGGFGVPQQSLFQGFSANPNVGGPSFSNDDTEDYSNEPPLLEELGIRFDHIWSKTQAVVNLRKVIHFKFESRYR